MTDIKSMPPRASLTANEIGSRPPPAPRKAGTVSSTARKPIETSTGSGSVWVVKGDQNVSAKLASVLTAHLGGTPSQQNMREYIAAFAKANPALKNLSAIVPDDRLMLPPPESVNAGWSPQRRSTSTATLTSPIAAPAPQEGDAKLSSLAAELSVALSDLRARPSRPVMDPEGVMPLKEAAKSLERFNQLSPSEMSRILQLDPAVALKAGMLGQIPAVQEAATRSTAVTLPAVTVIGKRNI